MRTLSTLLIANIWLFAKRYFRYSRHLTTYRNSEQVLNNNVPHKTYIQIYKYLVQCFEIFDLYWSLGLMFVPNRYLVELLSNLYLIDLFDWKQVRILLMVYFRESFNVLFFDLTRRYLMISSRQSSSAVFNLTSCNIMLS